jgi:hypothetical protein
MLLLMIAWQWLTRLELVAHRELAPRPDTLASLEPSHPTMKTDSPRAERMLAPFDGGHFGGEHTETHLTGKIFETLTPMPQRILRLLNVPESVYRIGFRVPVCNCFDSS